MQRGHCPALAVLPVVPQSKENLILLLLPATSTRQWCSVSVNRDEPPFPAQGALCAGA